MKTTVKSKISHKCNELLHYFVPSLIILAPFSQESHIFVLLPLKIYCSCLGQSSIPSEYAQQLPSIVHSSSIPHPPQSLAVRLWQLLPLIYNFSLCVQLSFLFSKIHTPRILTQVTLYKQQPWKPQSKAFKMYLACTTQSAPIKTQLYLKLSGMTPL